MPTRLRTAERYYRLSQRIARRGALQARQQAQSGAAATTIAATIVAYQATQASQVSASSTAILVEQSIQALPVASLNPLAFTTEPATLTDIVEQMRRDEADLLRQVERDAAAEVAALEADLAARVERMAESVIQDAGRAAQQVDATTREGIGHARHLTLPSCGRCAVLAGRIYRYSTGFERHPNCDCVMIPTTVVSPDLAYQPEELVRDGLIQGLSKADRQAVTDGADLGQVVNVRRRAAGLIDSGQVVSRAGRPTPAGIYRTTNSRSEALEALTRAGYLR